MPDPLWFVFGPGLAGFFGVLAAPIALAVRRKYRRRSARRNAQGACGRCGAAFFQGGDESLFVVEGHYVCAGCASALRRRLWVLLPATGLLAIAAVVSSTAGAVLAGPGLSWWLDSRLIPLLAPTVLVGGGLIGGAWLMKRLNRDELRAPAAGGTVPPGAASARQIEPPSAPAKPELPPGSPLTLSPNGA